MGGGESTFKTVVLEDGMSAVVRTDPAKPHLLEVVGIFYNEARARRYADFENGQLGCAARATDKTLPVPEQPQPGEKDRQHQGQRSQHAQHRERGIW